MNRAIKAGSWVVAGLVASQLIRLGSNLFLTRFLAPEAFGLLALSFTLIAGMNMFSDVGLQSNIVRSSRGGERDFLRTAWTVQVIRGGLLGLAVIALAALLRYLNTYNLFPSDSVYADKALPLVMVYLSIKPIIAGFLSINFHVAERSVDQKGRVILEFVSSLVPVPLMAGLVFISPTIWVLVIGAIVAELLKTIGSHWIFGGDENRFSLQRSSVKELIGFGKWVLLSSILGFMALQGDKLLLGGLLSPEVLGCYAIATLFFMASDQIIRRLQSSVAYPIISESYRSGDKSFLDVYYQFRMWMDPLILMIGVGLFVLGDDLIYLLYPDRYQEAAWMLSFLGVQVSLLVYALKSQLFLVIGKPRILSVMIFLRVVALVVGLPLTVNHFGVKPGIVLIAIAPSIEAVVCFFVLAKNRLVRFRRELLVIPYLAVSLLIFYTLEYAYHSVCDSCY